MTSCAMAEATDAKFTLPIPLIAIKHFRTARGLSYICVALLSQNLSRESMIDEAKTVVGWHGSVAGELGRSMMTMLRKRIAKHWSLDGKTRKR
jgi:hypothetical protein